MTRLQMVLVFFSGAILGSFLNVCIYRLPRKESILSPGSHCPKCKHAIPFLLNIPILSYCILRGRCKYCQHCIPALYPAVEILSGALLLLVWWHYGFGLSFVHYSILILLLVPISFIDLDTKLILNVLTLPGIVIGVISAILLNETSVLQAVAGLFTGGGFLWLVAILGKLFFKKDSMGGGDIKLAAMIGAFLGPEVLIALLLAFFLAFAVIVVGLSFKRLEPDATIPFGPFISLATVIMVCFGEVLYQQYFQIFGLL